jgi:hypothetical protein
VRDACKRRSRRACDALVSEAKRRERIAGATRAALRAWQQHSGFVFEYPDAVIRTSRCVARVRASACAHVTCAHPLRPAIGRHRDACRQSTCNAKPTVPSRALRTRRSASSNRATCAQCVRGARRRLIIAYNGHSCFAMARAVRWCIAALNEQRIQRASCDLRAAFAAVPFDLVKRCDAPGRTRKPLAKNS